jgi:hypothetical protein
MEDSSFRIMVGAQQAYSQHEVAQLYAAILAMCGAAADPGKRMLARIQSFACYVSAARLTARTTARALKLKDEEFRVAMQHRLGISLLSMRSVFGAVARQSPRQKMATTRWCALRCRGKVRCDMTSHPGFCAKSSTVQEWPPPLRRLPGLEAGAAARASRSLECGETCWWRWNQA